MNIVFISHAEKGPSGGAKIIYHHSEIINNLKSFSSEVLHLKKRRLSKLKISLKKRLKLDLRDETGWQLDQVMPVKQFNYKWFNHKIKTRNYFDFDQNKDFVILPEIFAHLANELLIKHKIPYAIFVQNGFALDSTNDFVSLKNAYKRARLILSVSESTTKMIKHVFGSFSKKIFKINFA